MGLLGLPSLTSVYTWVSGNVVAFNRLSLLVELLASIGVALWVSRKPSPAALINGALLVFAFILFFNPLTNPQYLVWILPLAAIFACDVMRASWLSRVSIVLFSIGGIGYVLSYFGWAFLFLPTSYAFRWPSTTSIANGLSFVGRTYHSSWLPNTVGGRVQLGCCTLVLIALALLFAQAFVQRPGVFSHHRDDYVRSAHSRFALPLLLSVSLVELVGLVAPHLVVTPNIKARVYHEDASSTKVLVSNARMTSIKVVAFPIEERRRIKTILFYQSLDRPTTGSEQTSILGTYQALSADLAISDSKVRLKTIDATEFASSVRSLKLSKSTLIVDVSGDLPNTVWRAHGKGPLLAWIRSGGILAFAGSVPGYYSVGPGTSLTVSGNSGDLARGMIVVGGGVLLPSSIIGSTNWNRSVANSQSLWSSTLNLQYNEDNFPISINNLKQSGGTVLGMTRAGLTSEAFVPIQQGGVLVFAGPDFAAQTSSIANDLTWLVCTNWFASNGPPTVRASDEKYIFVNARLPMPDDLLALAVFDSDRPQWLWEQDIK